MYKTNKQAWNEVMAGAKEHDLTMKIANELFPTNFKRVNLIGLNEDQRNLIYSKKVSLDKNEKAFYSVWDKVNI